MCTEHPEHPEGPTSVDDLLPRQELRGATMDSVNSVGVDLNTASPSLLDARHLSDLAASWRVCVFFGWFWAGLT